VHSSVTTRFRYSHLTLLASLFLLCFQDIWPRISLSCTSLRIVRGDTPILEAVSSVNVADTMSATLCPSTLCIPMALFTPALLSGYLASYIFSERNRVVRFSTFFLHYFCTPFALHRQMLAQNAPLFALLMKIVGYSSCPFFQP